MSDEKITVLTLTDLFPYPSRPASGIFVQRSVHALEGYCRQVVVVLVRVFPHLNIWKQLLRPAALVQGLREWLTEIANIPSKTRLGSCQVHYVRYTSPPRQLLGGLWGIFAYAFARKHLRRLYVDDPPQLIHAHYAVPSGLTALMAKRWMKVPVVVDVHGAEITYSARQNPLSRWIVKRVLRKADRVIVHSEWMEARIRSLGVAADCIRSVRLGAEPPGIDLRKSKARQDKWCRLLSVGYLIPRKGHRYVILAMHELIRQGLILEYVIVGGGECEAELRSLTSELGLIERVHFEGTRGPDDVWSYYEACDVFILPSVDEAFGLVFAEALACGKPVIACKGEGGPEELSALGDCIEKVKPHDVADIASAIKRLAEDPDRRHRMGETGRNIVRQHFSWNQTAQDTIKIYEEVLSKWKGSRVG